MQMNSAKNFVFTTSNSSNEMRPKHARMNAELAATGLSNHHNVHQLEQFLDYSVVSHGSLRQHQLATRVGEAKEKRSAPNVLFIEVDGLYIKKQSRSRHKKRRGRELKIADVHETPAFNTTAANVSYVSLILRRFVDRSAKTRFMCIIWLLCQRYKVNMKWTQSVICALFVQIAISSSTVKKSRLRLKMKWTLRKGERQRGWSFLCCFFN